ncbi:MAG TPA: hypothetical protein VHO50_06685 [Bacteroidales bacterium]|nr:hypothetical protein [Bacteroidales bacterium]
MKTFKSTFLLVSFFMFLLFNFTRCSFSGNKLALEDFQGFLNDSIFRVVDSRSSVPIKSDNEQNVVKKHIPESRNDLEKMRMVVKIYDGDHNAGLTIPGFGGVKLENKESNVNVYYIETGVYNDSVYGCGYSLHYLFKRVKNGIAIDNLPNVAASVQLNNNKTRVYYSMQTYGMIGDNLVEYFKPTINKNFNVEGYGIMQSSIDGIHNVLQDSSLYKSVRFKPELLKFIKVEDLEQIQ